MNKKKILITAGGTATAWHISKIITEHFSDFFEIHLCDINDQELVASSIYAHHYYVVPPIADPGYRKYMYELLKNNHIDIIIPLIDNDLYVFPSDDEDLNDLGVISTAPELNTVETLTDKKSMFHFLTSHQISTPMLYQIEDIEPNIQYAVKSMVGFGSRTFRILYGKDIEKNISPDDIIQELCIADKNNYEVTAEIFCYNGILRVFCRERIETKSGVCTKMKPIDDSEILSSIQKLTSVISCPRAFCVQFMRNNGHWSIIDCNLRLGAGTAMSSAIGFQLTRALLTTLLNQLPPDDFFQINHAVKSVLRVYDEVKIV
jgi:hypothetical protein